MKAIYPTAFLISSDDIVSLEEDLKKSGIDSFKTVLGRYKGTNETSLLVVTDSQRTVMSLAKKHKQESVLKLDCTRFASLLFTDDTVKELGQWQCVGTTIPEGDFTYDGRYYYTVK